MLKKCVPDGSQQAHTTSFGTILVFDFHGDVESYTLTRLVWNGKYQRHFITREYGEDRDIQR